MDEDGLNTTAGIFNVWKNIRIRLLIQGMIVGVSSGILVVGYRIALEKAEALRRFVLEKASGNILINILWFVFLILAGLAVGYLVKKEPLISGSGIPQVEASLGGHIQINPLSVIIKKFIGGAISICAGLSLGREGPSIQLGASLGEETGRIFKRTRTEEKYLITSGASAGLAAAFNAPLAGVMFSLEELHKHFSPLVLLAAMSASLTADFVSKNFFGLSPVFHVGEVAVIPLGKYPYLLVLGIITGAFGVLFNKSILSSQNLYRKIKLPSKYKMLIPFLLAGLLAFVFQDVLGGGHPIFELLMGGNLTLKTLIILLALKYVYTMISYGSGAPGGIFFPLLIIGALTGGLCGSFIVRYLGMDTIYIKNFVILSMAGYFTAIVRAPITGSILITEMTGSFQHLLPLSIISLTAYVVADLMKSEPIYESLLERLLKKNSSPRNGNKKQKVMLEIPIFLDSDLDGKAMKDIELDDECIIVSVNCGGKEIIPGLNTIFHSGDILNVLTEVSIAAELNSRLLKMSEHKSTQ